MVWNLPHGIEICVSIFSATSPKEWVNDKTKEETQSRCFDWTGKEPIRLGQERRYKNKEFVYNYVGEAQIQNLFEKGGWPRLANYVTSKTGIFISPIELEQKIKGLVESGAKRICLVSYAKSLGREACGNNRLLFRLDHFGGDNMNYAQGWNTRLEQQGSKWLIKLSKKRRR